MAVATQLFYEKGYEKASLQDIADRLGMLKGSLYYYFRSKEDLLFEVIHEVHEQGLAVVRRAAESPGRPLERLRHVVAAHVEHTCATLIPTAVFLHELSALPEARRREVLGEHSYQEVFRGLVEQARNAGEARADVEPRLAALSILGSTNWVYRWYRADGPVAARDIAAQLADMAVRSIEDGHVEPAQH
jgi:AcrR family transcriptional regulator